MKRIYQRHSYATEMATAWNLLGEHLETLTNFEVSNPHAPISISAETNN